MAAKPTSSSQWPEWTMAPTLNYWQEDPKTILLSRYIKNPQKQPIGYSLAVGSAALPSGVAFSLANNEGLAWTGSGVNGITTGIKFRATNLLTGYHIDSPLTQIKIAGAIVLPPTAPINVTATALSTSTIRVAWTAGPGGSAPATYRIYRATSPTGPFTHIATDATSPYDDTSLTAGVTRYYTVAMVDGSNEVSSQSLIATAMTFPGPPAIPVNVNAAGISDSEISVTWQAGVGGPPAVAFKVYRAEALEGPFEEISEDVASVTTYIDGPNTDSTTIYFTVTAIDASDVESAQSAIAAGTTMPKPLPAVPINVAATALSSTSIRVTWSTGSGGGVQTGFRIVASDTGEDGTYANIANVGDVRQYDDTTLSAGQTRYYRVAAFNNDGTSSRSLPAFATTSIPQPPAVPVGVAAEGTTQTNIRVTWSAGSGGTSPTGYRIFSAPSSNGPFTFLASDTASPYDDGTVVASETRWYTVSASNANGESQQSTPASGKALDIVLPATPTSVSATAISMSTIRIAWLPGVGGSTPTSYKIYASSTSNGVYTMITNTVSNPYDHTGLSGGTTRFYKVVATDGSNDSAESAIVTATTQALPDVPTGVQADGISNTTIRVTWNAAAGATAYRVYRSGSQNGTFTQQAEVSAPTTTYNHVLADNPPENNTRWYRVAAVNGAGVSAQSVADSGTTFAFAGPAVPVNVTAVATAQGTIRVSWSPGASGTTVANYKLYRSTTAGGSATVIATQSGTTYDDTGLPDGVARFYRVSAVDSTPTESAKSTEVSATTPAAQVPAVPVNVTATATSDTAISIAWSNGSGGSTPVSYRIYRSNTASGPFSQIATDSASPYVDTVAELTTRFYTVAAVDTNGGVSGQSLVVSATTPASQPATPVNVTAVAQSQSTIRVSWTNGTDGIAPVAVRVFRSNDGSSNSYSQIAEVAASPYDDTSLSAGTTRFYKLRGVNGSGDVSPLSAAANATTSSALVPAMPTITSVTAQSQSTLRISWTPGSGGSTVTAYRIYRSTASTGPFTQIAQVSAPTTQYDNTGLNESTTRWYRVSAVDAGANESVLSVTQYGTTFGSFATFTVSAGTSSSTFDGQSRGVVAGDVITLEAGTHGPRTLTGLYGTQAKPIHVRSSSSGKAIIRNSSSGSSSEVFRIRGCQHLIIDGSYTSGQDYGILVTHRASGSDSVTTYLKIDDGTEISHHVTIKNVEVDGGWPSVSATSGTGIQFNDHDTKKANHAGYYRDGCKVLNSWIHDVYGEGVYFGPNYEVLDIPLSNCEFAYNIVEGCGREGLQAKSWWSGTNSIHHNIARNNGLRGESSQNSGLALLSGKADIYNNDVRENDGNGIQCFVTNGPPRSSSAGSGYGTFSKFTIRIYNNLCAENGGRGINVGNPSDLTHFEPFIYNNTCASNTDTGIQSGSNSESTGWIRNNVVVANGSQISAGSVGNTNNTTGTNLNVFTNAAGGDYTLASAIAASGTIGTDIAATDLSVPATDEASDTSRPQGASSDRGAYEKS